MSAVENVIAAIAVMMIFLVAGLIYMGSFAEDTVFGTKARESVFQDDQYRNNFMNIIEVTEPYSKQKLSYLLGNAVYYKNMTPNFNGEIINITEEFRFLLDRSFGKGRYYLIAKPEVVEISLNFIVDGSKTLTEEKEFLAEKMPIILNNVEKKLNKSGTLRKTSANIFMLPNKKFNPCQDVFNISDPRIRCILLSEDMLYITNPINLSNTSYSIEDLDYFKQKYKLNASITADDWDEWSEHKVKSDWASGTAYASFYNKNVDMSKFTILFPLSDQLSTSSVNQKCFERETYCGYSICSLCEESCPVNRSLNSVNKSVQAVVNESFHIINPIFSMNCDYQNAYYFAYDTYDNATIDSGWNACDNGNSFVQNNYGSDPAPTWCNLDTCNGCEDQSGNICFHSACADDIRAQMAIMANETNGQVLNLYDINTLDVQIDNIVANNVEQYYVSIGEEKDLPREVVEFSIPTPNNLDVKARLWVYKSK